jgi:hypothetical protein
MEIPKERMGTRVSLKALLGKHFDKFLQQFFYEPIEEWAEEGKIDLVTLKRLNQLIAKHGKDVLDIPADRLNYTTRHTLEEGDLLRVQFPITGSLAIDNFVKIFSDYDRFRHAIQIQEAIYNHVKGTDLEDVVVEPLFTNHERNLVSYPFINASSFSDMVHELPEEEKEAKLLDVIKEYQQLSHELTQHREIFDKYDGSMLRGLMDVDTSFDRFFFKRLGHGDIDTQLKNAGYKTRERAEAFHGDLERFDKTPELRALISKYFAPIDEGDKYVIHGDLNLGNVIMREGVPVFIDQEDACLGYLEFDYCKLLTKAGLSDEAEERIVRKAAEHLSEVEGKEVDVEASVKRYTLDRVGQELFTAVRYMKRARENNDSLTMKNMALVAYNTALRKIDRAAEKGYIGADFRETLEKFMRENHDDHFFSVDDESYLDLKEIYDPHLRQSQENVVSAPSLDLLIAGESDETEVKKELKKLKKNLKKKDWKKIRRASYIGGTIAALLGGLVAGAVMWEDDVMEAAEQVETMKQEDMYKNLMFIARGDTQATTDVAILYHRFFDLTKRFGGDKGTAYAWLLDSDLTYEVMQETGSQEYKKIREYLIKRQFNDAGYRTEYDNKCFSLRVKVDHLVDKGEYLDAWMRMPDGFKNYHNKEYAREIEEAKKKYDAKKALLKQPEDNAESGTQKIPSFTGLNL